MARRMAARYLSAPSFVKILPILIGLVLSCFLYAEYRFDIDTLEVDHRLEQDSKSRVLAQEIEVYFDRVHQAMRTVGDLSELKQSGNKHFDLKADTSGAYSSALQIYDHLSSTAGVGLLQITHLGSSGSSSAIVFNQNAAPFPTSDWNTKKMAMETTIKEQIAQLKTICPTNRNINLVQYPALISKVTPLQVSRYKDVDLASHEQIGFVYTTPFFSSDGRLHGVVSSTIPLKALNSMLRSSDNLLYNMLGHQTVSPGGSRLGTRIDEASRTMEGDSSTYPLSIPDTNGHWTLQTSNIMGGFQDREDVYILRKTISAAYVVVWVGLIVLMFSVSLVHRRLEQQIEGLLNGSQEVMFLTTSDGKITHVGSQAEKTLGIAANQLRGTYIYNYILPSDRRDMTDFLRAPSEAESENSIREFRFQTASQRFEWFEVSVSNLARSHRRRGLFVLLKNVEVRKKTENALRAAKESAENANMAKSEFLSRVSHELRTPLNAILGFGQLLSMAQLEENERDNVDQILGAGRHLLKLVNEILDLSRIESGAINMSIEAVECKEVIDAVLNFVGPMAKQYEVTTSIECEDSLLVLADRQRLVQILINLCSNAIKYNRPGGTVCIKVSTHESACTDISVVDNGNGISEQAQERLFVPFDRLGAEKLTIEGTGLGLSLSKDLVEAMDGRIMVHSTEGVGTTVTVRLPIAHQYIEPIIYEFQPQIRPRTVQEPTRILSIEDNCANQVLLTKILSDYPEFELHSVSQGAIGLERIETLKPDIVLLDLHLEDIPGLEVLEQIRQNPFADKTKIIVLSADTNPTILERALFIGADHIHQKPINVSEFLSLLTTIAEAA